MHLSGTIIFQNVNPWVPKVNLSVAQWLPCEKSTKIHLVPNAGMLFGQVTLRHPGRVVAEALEALKAIISNTKTSRPSKTRQNVSCNVKISFLMVKAIIGCLPCISQAGSCWRNHQFFPSSCSPTSPATFSKSLNPFNFRIVALASKALQRSCNSPP